MNTTTGPTTPPAPHTGSHTGPAPIGPAPIGPDGLVRHILTGHDGHPLVVAEGGDPTAPPLLLLHGFGQSHLAFRPLLLSSTLAARHRLLALDLRGHGGSQPQGAPDPAAYGDGPHWGADVAAVLRHLGAEGALLAGWSYGGAVVGDYLAWRAHHAAEDIGPPPAGLILVGACPCLGAAARPYLGPDAKRCFPPLLADDFATQVDGARALARALAPDQAAADVSLAALLACPLPVRRAIMRRQTDHTATLARWPGPALIIHGAEDSVILPAMAAHLGQTMPQAEVRVVAGAGHAPFDELAAPAGA